jgi:regulatory protein YycI of two-component signal transduction system YycFG
VESIAALHRNHNGEIINFVTTNGRVISYRKALMEAESGLIQGVQAIQDENGNSLLMPEYEKSFDHLPDLF